MGKEPFWPEALVVEPNDHQLFTNYTKQEHKLCLVMMKIKQKLSAVKPEVVITCIFWQNCSFRMHASRVQVF